MKAITLLGKIVEDAFLATCLIFVVALFIYLEEKR